MAGWIVGPIMENLMGKLIDTCSQYFQHKSRSQTDMEKELKRLQENYPKIQAVISAVSEAQLTDLDPDSLLNKWIWQLRDAIDEADDLLDDFEYMKLEEQLAGNREETNKRSAGSFLLAVPQKLRRVGECSQIDPNLARLEEVVHKLDKISTEVSTFLHLFESKKQVQQDQQLELYKIRETGSLPKTDLIGRGKDMEFVIRWLRKPPNEEHPSNVTAIPRYHNISVLSIVCQKGPYRYVGISSKD